MIIAAMCEHSLSPPGHSDFAGCLLVLDMNFCHQDQDLHLRDLQAQDICGNHINYRCAFCIANLLSPYGARCCIGNVANI